MTALELPPGVEDPRLAEPVALLVGIACYGSMLVETALSLTSAVAAYRNEGGLIVSAQKGPYTHWNREALVRSAVETASTHLLMIDTDISFRQDAITRLVARRHLGAVVGATYRIADDRDRPVFAHKNIGQRYDGGYIRVEVPREPFECAAVPAGFMLIDVAALAGLERPLFRCEEPEGEDVRFCRIVREAGLQVWCDPTIPIGHIKEKTY